MQRLRIIINELYLCEVLHARTHSVLVCMHVMRFELYLCDHEVLHVCLVFLLYIIIIMHVMIIILLGGKKLVCCQDIYLTLFYYVNCIVSSP